MRNKHSNRILGRTANHRKALMKSLTFALLEHGSIVTTEAKAKELRRHIEPLITSAKEEMTLARRRRLLAQVGTDDALDQLEAVADANKQRPGGYLRLTHLPLRRSDNVSEVRVDIIATEEK